MKLKIYFILFYFSIANGKPKSDRMVFIKEYKDCNLTLPFVQGLKVTVAGRGQLAINGDLNITENVGNITLLVVKVEKCQSAGDLGSCEYFTTAKYKNPCSLIMAKNQMWSEAFNHFKPRLTCPIKKGQYVLSNAMLDPAFVAMLPGLDQSYWRPMVKIYKNERLVSCFRVGISIDRVRMRDS